jgi:Rod binding domain-containing protein
MAPSPIPPISSAQPVSAAEIQKVAAAAHEFEAMLLETFLKPLEDSFSTLPGGDDSMGASGYRDMGTQAIASAITQAGGLGLADMMVRNLLHQHGPPSQATAIGTGGRKAIKGFPAYADSN